MSWRKQQFDYSLPPELIAQYPQDRRGDSRLLHLSKQGEIKDAHFQDLLHLLKPEDLLVFNNTKVMPARLYGRKPTGGKVEILIERIIAPRQAWCLLGANKPIKIGSDIWVADHGLQVLDKQQDLFLIEASLDLYELMQQHGHIPLPPYIQRQDQDLDQSRYQTVYAKQLGSVAAPTAGLHFDQALLQQLKQKGVRMAELTLHVGAGTFQPVRVDDLSQHRMHSEWLEVPESVVKAVKTAHQRGGRVIAVGTTSVRSLETAAANGEIKAYRGETQLFITPGYKFKVVDALITNFHLPQSTLLMLVCALAGYEPTLKAYRHAVAQKYRFFSYGDAMFID